MARYMPRSPWIVSEVCDVDQLNDQFAGIHSDMSSLNEHNWDLNALQNMEPNWAPDIGIRFHEESTSIDPYGGSVVALEASAQWSAMPGGSKTITTRGGKFMIISSFQTETENNNSATREPGLMFALRINGTVEYGSLIGSADLSNDAVQQASVPASYTFPGFDLETAPAIRGGFIPLVIEKLVTLPAGVHTIEVVSRNVQTYNGTIVQNGSQMMLVVLELWA